MRRRYLLTGLVALLAVMILAAVACGGTTTTTMAGQTETTAVQTETTVGQTAGTTGPIKVGHIVDVTGIEANVGAQFKVALEYALQDASVGDRPVELILADSKSETAAAVDAAKKLVEQDNVVAIFGPTQIGQKTAVAEYCKQAGVPLILYNPTPPAALEDNQWVFGSGGTTMQTPTVIADYAYNDLGYRSVVTLTYGDSAGHAWADPFKEHFEALGGTVVDQQWAPFTEDYSPYLSTLKDADALVAWYGGAGGMQLLNQYLELGIDKKMPLVALYHGGFTDPWLINTIAQSNPEGAQRLVGICAPMAWDPDSTSPENTAYVQGITPMLPYGPPGDDGYACPVQAAQLFLTAAGSVTGELTSDALRQAIAATSFTGPEGPEFFAPGDQAATKNIYVVKVISADIPNVGTVYMYTTVKTYEAVPPAGLVD